MAIEPLPSLDRTSPTFKQDVDTFFATRLPVFSVQVEAAREEIVAAEDAATDAAEVATTKAGEALTSANNASTSEGNALNYKNDALAAKTAAEAALDSFDDRYLGAKAVEPALDNDGNALINGALYWDTVLNGGCLRVWQAPDWVTIPANVASAITNTPAGGIAATTVQAAINELDGKKSRGLFVKPDTQSAAFTKTAASTISLKAGTYIDVAGTLLTFAAATAVTMPALTAGTDFAVYACADGSLRADASFTAPAGYTAANSRLIGGFHYGLVAPGTTVAGGSFNTAGSPVGGGMVWTQADVDKIAGINAYSLWDLKWRANSRDIRAQKGMALTDAGTWVALYYASTDTDANGLSKYNTNVASGTVLPKVPAVLGGNGALAYADLNWYTANELVSAYGARLLRDADAGVAFFGVTENQSLGGATTTIPATARQAGYTSKYGIEQATGHHWTWGDDSAGTTATAYVANGGRGQSYANSIVKVILSGSRDYAANSGSRASSWGNVATYSAWSIGVRAACDHLILA